MRSFLLLSIALLLTVCGKSSKNHSNEGNSTEVTKRFAVAGDCSFLTTTFDGYPVFAGPENGCDYIGLVYSADGKDTYDSCPKEIAGCQRSEDFGYQCTELAIRYFHFRWNVDLPIEEAYSFCPNAKTSFMGASFTTSPVKGDLAVMEANNECGSGSDGHVAIVDNIEANGSIDLAEQNWFEGSGKRSGIEAKCFCGFIHAENNR